MGEWQPMETAPKDGTYIIGLYDDGAEDIICWEEQRRCMLAWQNPGAGECGEGWESKIAGGLPVDPPKAWKPMK